MSTTTHELTMITIRPRKGHPPTGMIRSGLLSLLAVIAGLITPATTADEITQAQVEEMVEAMVAEFRLRHDPVRHWEPAVYPDDNTAQPTGRTALVALAMLEAGEPAQSEKLSEALRWIAENPANGTYAIAVRLMVWCRMPEEYRPLAQAELQRLLDRFSLEAGGWDYIPEPRPWLVDQSLTQYALQAIADAQEAGLKVPPRIIDMVRGRFLALQTEDGGWGYQKATDTPRGSMTAAGLATLALCERIRPANDRTRKAVERSISRAIAWLDRHFDPETNPGHTPRMSEGNGKAGDYWLYYWLHALERAGRATGLRRFSNQDWFEACATSIRDRMFQGNLDTGLSIKWSPANDHMAFALFVLQRGLESIPFGLFETTDTLPVSDELGPASQTLSDVIEEGVGWTRISLNDDLDAWKRLPLVVVRGDGKASWLKDPESPEARRLLEYAANGGVVLTAPSDRGLFSKNLTTLFKTAHPSLTTRKIESKDSIRNQPTPWRGRAEVLESPVRLWLVTTPRLALGSDSNAKNVKDAANMLSAICLAETGGRLPSRAEADALSDATARRTIRLSRNLHGGDWEPEPAMLGRLAVRARNAGILLEIEPPSAAPESGEGVLWISGSTAEDAAALDIDALAVASEGGRRLLVESLDKAFTASLTGRLASAGWKIGAPPPNCPPGTARLRTPAGGGGLLVTASISRPLMGRRAEDGTSISNVIQLVQVVADLESPDPAPSGG